MAKDAYYFSHDSNAKDDPKCVLLIEQLGLEGYGIYWVLIETLRDQPDYRYPVNLIPALARRYNTTAEKMKAVVGGYDLFTVDDNDFFSLSLMERMQKLDEKREIQRQKALKRWNPATAIPEQCHGNAEVVPLKESKVKESKVKESKGKENNKYKDVPAELIEPLKAFEDMRKKIKAPLTDRALELMLKKLNQLSGGDIDTSIAILEQSIMNSWKGIFELKQEKRKAKEISFMEIDF